MKRISPRSLKTNEAAQTDFDEIAMSMNDEHQLKDKGEGLNIFNNELINQSDIAHLNSPNSEAAEAASPSNEKLKIKKMQKSDESIDSYRREVLMQSSSKKPILLPNFISPPSS